MAAIMDLLADLRLGAPTLWKRSGAYSADFLTPSVGLAAATTMFSIVSTVLLEPLPYPNADRLAPAASDRTAQP